MSCCRLCLSDGAVTYIFNGPAPDLAARIRACCLLRVKKNDGLPDRICSKCLFTLENVCEFIRTCRQSDKFLRNEVLAINEEINMNEDIIVNEDIIKIEDTGMNEEIIVKEETVENEDIVENEEIMVKEEIIENQNENDGSENYVPNNRPFLGPGVTTAINESSIKKEPEEKMINVEVKVENTDENNVFNDDSIHKIKSEDHIFHEKYSDCNERTMGENTVQEINIDIKTHNPMKDFSCSACCKTFISDGKLREHELTHMNIKNTFSPDHGRKLLKTRCRGTHTKKKQNQLPKSTCHICQKTLTSHYMEKHMKIHTGQLDYECDICNKKFAQKSNIVCHMRTHTGERPYACSYCPSKFSISRSRNEHERLHTGETPFKCSVCGKGFAQRANMKSHFKYNHPTFELTMSCD